MRLAVVDLSRRAFERVSDGLIGYQHSLSKLDYHNYDNIAAFIDRSDIQLMKSEADLQRVISERSLSGQQPCLEDFILSVLSLCRYMYDGSRIDVEIISDGNCFCDPSAWNVNREDLLQFRSKYVGEFTIKLSAIQPELIKRELWYTVQIKLQGSVNFAYQDQSVPLLHMDDEISYLPYRDYSLDVPLDTYLQLKYKQGFLLGQQQVKKSHVVVTRLNYAWSSNVLLSLRLKSNENRLTVEVQFVTYTHFISTLTQALAGEPTAKSMSIFVAMLDGLTGQLQSQIELDQQYAASFKQFSPIISDTLLLKSVIVVDITVEELSRLFGWESSEGVLIERDQDSLYSITFEQKPNFIIVRLLSYWGSNDQAVVQEFMKVVQSQMTIQSIPSLETNLVLGSHYRIDQLQVTLQESGDFKNGSQHLYKLLKSKFIQDALVVLEDSNQVHVVEMASGFVNIKLQRVQSEVKCQIWSDLVDRPQAKNLFEESASSFHGFLSIWQALQSRNEAVQSNRRVLASMLSFASKLLGQLPEVPLEALDVVKQLLDNNFQLVYPLRVLVKDYLVYARIIDKDALELVVYDPFKLQVKAAVMSWRSLIGSSISSQNLNGLTQDAIDGLIKLVVTQLNFVALNTDLNVGKSAVHLEVLQKNATSLDITKIIQLMKVTSSSVKLSAVVEPLGYQFNESLQVWFFKPNKDSKIDWRTQPAFVTFKLIHEDFTSGEEPVIVPFQSNELRSDESIGQVEGRRWVLCCRLHHLFFTKQLQQYTDKLNESLNKFCAVSRFNLSLQLEQYTVADLTFISEFILQRHEQLIYAALQIQYTLVDQKGQQVLQRQLSDMCGFKLIRCENFLMGKKQDSGQGTTDIKQTELIICEVLESIVKFWVCSPDADRKAKDIQADMPLVLHRTNQVLLLQNLNYEHHCSKYLVAPLQQHSSDEDESDMPGFKPGQFECRMVSQWQIELNNRLRPNQALQYMTSNVLNTLVVSNRKNMFIYANKDNYWYIKLKEIIKLESNASISTDDMSIQSSPLITPPVKQEGQNTLQFEMYGVDVPDASDYEDLRQLCQTRLNALTLQVVSAFLSRNPTFSKLSVCDYEFLFQGEVAAQWSVSSQQSTAVKFGTDHLDSYLYTLTFQEVQSSWLSQYFRDKLETELTPDNSSVMFYNSVTSKASSTQEFQIGQGLACVLIYHSEEQVKILVWCQGNLDLGKLQDRIQSCLYSACVESAIEDQLAQDAVQLEKLIESFGPHNDAQCTRYVYEIKPDQVRDVLVAQQLNFVESDGMLVSGLVHQDGQWKAEQVGQDKLIFKGRHGLLIWKDQKLFIYNMLVKRVILMPSPAS